MLQLNKFQNKMETDHLIGKRVIISTPSGRDNAGKSNGSKVQVGGICSYVGPNELLDIPLVITLNRTPFVITDMKDIIKVE